MKTKTIQGGDKLQAFFKKITSGKAELNVGFLDSEQAKIAIKNEFGGVFPISDEYRARAKAKGIILGNTIAIPSRPFMQRTVDENTNKWGKVIQKISPQLEFDLTKVLNTLGQVVVDDIAETIEMGEFVANSARTIAIKQRGKPLVDSGDMVNNINYEVK